MHTAQRFDNCRYGQQNDRSDRSGKVPPRLMNSIEFLYTRLDRSDRSLLKHLNATYNWVAGTFEIDHVAT